MIKDIKNPLIKISAYISFITGENYPTIHLNVFATDYNQAISKILNLINNHQLHPNFLNKYEKKLISIFNLKFLKFEILDELAENEYGKYFLIRMYYFKKIFFKDIDILFKIDTD